jgi:hypothetical protein
MAWSPDAEKLWWLIRADQPRPAATPGQTAEQALALAAESFRTTCRFVDGIEPPTAAEVEERLRAQSAVRGS